MTHGFSSDDEALELLLKYGIKEKRNGLIKEDRRIFNVETWAAVCYLCDEWDFAFIDTSQETSMTKIEIAVCEICGEPMPPGEEMFNYHGYSGPCPSDIIGWFKKHLSTISHSRAGWDYELTREQRTKENREEKEAMAMARKIWADNPDRHDDLRTAFKECGPLATMSEIERAA